MSRDWQTTFSNWAKGPGTTEQKRADNAESMIKSALMVSQQLQSRDIHVFTQGSYRNHVNVKKDSDVDIGIVCYDTYFPEYEDENIKMLVEETSIDATYTYNSFKDEIEEALIDKFGWKNVHRGNKSFDINENTYRVEADVAAFFEHRRYTSATRYISGVEMIADNSHTRIRNWPEQHYKNSVDKNTRTSRRYKRVVRILKSLSNEMTDEGIASAKLTSSFLVECLVWNAPDDHFEYPSLKGTVRAVLAWLFNNTMQYDQCKEWGEASELKYLFRSSQPWTRKGAHQFLSDAWGYVGFD